MKTLTLRRLREMKKQVKITKDMLDLIQTINKIEPDTHKAYQYEDFARKIIFMIANNENLEDIFAYIDNATNEKELHSCYIADDRAREFFKRYKNGELKRIAYELHNELCGDKYLSELQAKYKEMGNDFFI